MRAAFWLTTANSQMGDDELDLVRVLPGGQESRSLVRPRAGTRRRDTLLAVVGARHTLGQRG
jgi:hypothetical protein